MKILKKHTTLFLIALIMVFFVGGLFVYQKIFSRSQIEQPVNEVDLNFDPEGPYALLFPRRDGNALVLNLKRTASYDKITYELAYNAEGIDRGVMGEINTKEKKGEYEQEILFGTCSKNVCKYDKGVENGTLTLHILKDDQAYRMITQWHLQQPDLALGNLTSGDSHLSYKIGSKDSELSLVKYTIINELTGAPKLPTDKAVVGKVYAINTPIAKTLPKGVVTIELVEDPPPGSRIARYSERENRWVLMDTKVDGSKLTANVDGAGVVTVLSPVGK